MRPVERGPAPQIYARYGDALDDLVTRLGSYCSYCERRLPTGLAVEHVQPKSRIPTLETEWNNFLLGCRNCNSVKGAQPVVLDNFLWPDLHNTLMALEYSEGGFVRVANNLTGHQRQRAEGLLMLVGLNRHAAPGWPSPARRDKRWSQRDAIWASAIKCRSNFELLGHTIEAQELVVTAATGYGFFSIWMTIFNNYPAVKLALIGAFTGTVTTCFDHDGTPVNRPGAII